MIKCTGLIGRLIGHKWLEYGQPASKDVAMLYRAIFVPGGQLEIMPEKGFVCMRCGAFKEVS